MTISFFVRGTPRPGGSKTAMPIYGKGGHAVTRQTATGKFRPVLRYVDDAKGNKEWRALVATEATRAMRDLQRTGDPPVVLHACALSVEFHFFVARPKSHFRSNGALKPNAPAYPTSTPDALKLARSTEDALTGIVWADDAANVRITIAKDYTLSKNLALMTEGCAIKIETV